MGGTGLEDLPLEVSEEILALLGRQDILNARLVSQKLNYVATYETDKYICFPVSKPLVRDPEAREQRRILDEQTRVRAISLLSNVEKAVAVRKFTLGVANETDDYLTGVPPEEIVASRVEMIVDFLTEASNLRYLVIHTESDVAFPILSRLFEWRKLHRLSLLVSRSSSYLACSRLQCLTLRLEHHALRGNEEVNTIPALPLLSRLKIESVWPHSHWDLLPSTRCNFSHYPKLAWLKLCGIAPAQYLHTYEGHTTSLRTLIIGDDRDCIDTGCLNFARPEASIFFSRFSEDLEALIIYNGKFRNSIGSAFPKLRSLKIFSSFHTRYFQHIQILKCPQLAQLSLVSRCRGYRESLSQFAQNLLPLYASKLHSLQLIREPFDFDNYDGRQYLEELGDAAIYEVGRCKNLKFIELSGFLYMSKRNTRLLGESVKEVEAVMQTFPQFGKYYPGYVDFIYKRLLIAHPITGLQLVKCPKGHKTFALRATSVQVSKPLSTWKDLKCPCGWTQRRQFARHVDPENLFVDDDDEVDHERGFMFKDDDEARHMQMDIKINEDVLRWNNAKAKAAAREVA